MEFQPLASSSSGCAYIVRSPGMAPLLIDCGISYRAIQKALDFNVGGLAGCLVSHAHGDHCASVPDLLSNGVDVWGSEGFWSVFKAGAWKTHHRQQKLYGEKSVKVGGWIVVPFNVRHDSDGTMGFVVSDGKDNLLYLTDTQFSDYKFSDLTIIAVEANWGEDKLRENSRFNQIHGSRVKRVATNHMSIERVERLLEANDLTKVREIHLLHLSDQNSDEAGFKTRIQRLTGKPVFIAAKTAHTEVL